MALFRSLGVVLQLRFFSADVPWISRISMVWIFMDIHLYQWISVKSNGPSMDIIDKWSWMSMPPVASAPHWRQHRRWRRRWRQRADADASASASATGAANSTGVGASAALAPAAPPHGYPS